MVPKCHLLHIRLDLTEPAMVAPLHIIYTASAPHETIIFNARDMGFRDLKEIYVFSGLFKSPRLQEIVRTTFAAGELDICAGGPGGDRGRCMIEIAEREDDCELFAAVVSGLKWESLDGYEL
jgi:hypothetical protein